MKLKSSEKNLPMNFGKSLRTSGDKPKKTSKPSTQVAAQTITRLSGTCF